MPSTPAQVRLSQFRENPVPLRHVRHFVEPRQAADFTQSTESYRFLDTANCDAAPGGFSVRAGSGKSLSNRKTISSYSRGDGWSHLPDLPGAALTNCWSVGRRRRVLRRRSKRAPSTGAAAAAHKSPTDLFINLWWRGAVRPAARLPRR